MGSAGYMSSSDSPIVGVIALGLLAASVTVLSEIWSATEAVTALSMIPRSSATVSTTALGFVGEGVGDGVCVHVGVCRGIGSSIVGDGVDDGVGDLSASVSATVLVSTLKSVEGSTVVGNGVGDGVGDLRQRCRCR